MSNDQDDTVRKAAIRSLNDQFRNTFQGGAVVVTAGIAALEETLLTNSIKTSFRLKY